MSAHIESAPIAPARGRDSDSGADLAVGRRAFGQLWIGASVWSLVFGGSAAASALNYVSSFPTIAARQQIAATTGKDTGFAVLLGPVSAVGTVGGYTVYKCFVFLTTIGAIWALLATTRLLRGEEDAGRWQLVLAGNTRASRATAATLTALGAGVAVIFAGTTVIVMLAGRNSKLGFGFGETALYGLSIAIAPAVFVGVGALTSQLGRTRRVATGLGACVFGVTFVVRMIADSGPQTRWLLWATPFGWTELVRPFTRNDPWPLLPAAAAALALCVGASILASRRDVGDGVLSSADVSLPRAFGLRSPVGLAVRLERAVLGAWCVGAAVAAFALGVIAKVTTGTVPASFDNYLKKFGAHGSFLDQYLGVAFLLLATTVALISANQVGAASDEETSGRLVHVLAQPTDRRMLFAGRLVLSAAAILSASLLAGFAAWLGAATQGINAGLGPMIGAGLNVVPVSLVALGIGAAMLSVAPRAAVSTVYAVVIGSLVIDLLGSTIPGIRWLEHVSLFHYMALVPAQDADARALVLTIAVAVALCVVATILFARRDMQSA